MTGTTFSHYRVIEKLGAGGMGEVYRAEDTTLGRHVAIKVLPELFQADPERLARFEREAKTLASLNHPHLAAIYGLEQAEGRRFLVLELVEGETLAQRISRGPLPLEEALEVCRQVAEGLEAAHDKGIIHRDLKPSNVKVTVEGKVKILDFGLAKAFHDQPAGAATEESPTITDTMTRPGVLLGTAAYMAPEQAKGKAVDKRVDVWAFGCVLYECLTGQRAFRGESITEVLARILESEPDWSLLPPDTPTPMQALLRRCLHKDRSRRQRDIADARIEIEEALAGARSMSEQGVEPRGKHPRWRQAMPWGLVVLALLAAGVAVWSPWRGRSLPTAQPTRFAINLPQGESIATTGPGSAVALSPDGRRLAYVVRRGTMNSLCVRRLEQFQAETIPGTEDATVPFFSPDGNWLGFHAQGRLMRVSLSGGGPQTICETTLAGRACWLENDTIVFGRGQNYGLWQVAASGGEPKELTTALRGSGERREMHHVSPHALPGGGRMLFTVLYLGNSAIACLSPETGQYRILAEPGSCAHYLAPGYIVYHLESKLMAVPFDLASARVTGPPLSIMEGVMAGGRGESASYASAHFCVSRNGTLTYVTGAASREFSQRLVRVDLVTGKVEPLPFPSGKYQSPRIAPDGERLLAVKIERLPHVWIYGLASGSARRFSDDRGEAYWAAWSPDGKEVAFNSSMASPTGNDVYVRPADGSSLERRLTTNQYHLPPQTWADGGKTVIAVRGIHPETGFDIMRVSTETEGTPQPLLNGRFNEWDAAISPSGQWLAYVSDESRRAEVYIRPYPGPGNTVQVTAEGGREPVWDPSGKTLYFRDDTGHKVFKVPIQTEPAVQVGTPALLFEGAFKSGIYWGRNYDLSPKGDFFIMIEEDEPPPATQINTVLNWSEELKR